MLCHTQLVIVGATGMVSGYALKDPAVESATSIGRKVRGITRAGKASSANNFVGPLSAHTATEVAASAA
jgi:hypothetical protein